MEDDFINAAMSGAASNITACQTHRKIYGVSGCVFCVNGIWLVTPVAEWVALAQDFTSRTNTGIIIDILENEKS